MMLGSLIKFPSFALLLALLPETISAAEPLQPNREILDKPLTTQKLVLAHYMTAMLPCSEGELAWLDLDLYYPNGRAAKLGGLWQTAPMCMFLLGKRRPPLAKSVLRDIRAAKQLGIDGFHFFYPCHTHDGFMQKYARIIETFFQVAGKDFPDFKLTLCLCNPRGGSPAEKIRRWSRHIRGILSNTKDSTCWLKTPDGRTVFYLWVPDALAEGPGKKRARDPVDQIRRVATAYEDLSRSIGIDTAYIYHVRWPQKPARMKAVLDYFPAIWGWTDNLDNAKDWLRLAKLCKKRKRDYTQTVYPDYYTSKLYDKATHRLLFKPEEILKKDPEQLQREYQVCKLSHVYRKLLERAIDTKASLINFTTWNDYPEGHHLAPEINHNFGFALILEYYKNIWQGHAHRNDREAAIVFFKKYAHAKKPQPFSIAYKIKRQVDSEACEDIIEVVTILKQPADLYVNGKHRGKARRGLVSTTMPLQAGPVKVEVKRRGKTVMQLITPEWVTDRPYRTDRLTYCYSTRFAEIYKRIFGDTKPPVSDEYVTGEDGIPNWQKRRKTSQP